MTLWLENWRCGTHEESLERMAEDFEIASSALDGLDILLAYYGYGSYSGSAFVLFRGINGKLYEVNASHCSCYGLEDQWNPDETSKSALLLRIEDGELGNDRYADGGVFRDELIKILESLEN